jgi:hypothetical protein
MCLNLSLTMACKKYKCHYTALNWEVVVDKSSGNPYIKVRK